VNGFLGVTLNFALQPFILASKILQSMMTMRTDQINLANSEMSYPGKEVSYIYKANQSFAPGKD